MPKKQRPSYSTTKPQAQAHSSLATTTLHPVKEAPKSVNERIRDYRAQAASSTIRSLSSNEDILCALSAEARTLPAAPRTPHRLRNLRTPGPAAPASWDTTTAIGVRGGVVGSIHGPRAVLGENDNRTLPGLPGQPTAVSQSLRSFALKVLAESLDLESTGDIADCLDSIMRMQLIEIMAQRKCLDRNIVNIILSCRTDDSGNIISGGELMSHIVLGPMMKTKDDWTFLRKLVKRPRSKTTDDEIPETWDTNQHDDENDGSIRLKAIRLAMLPHLTHLSLSRAPLADWNSLLWLGSSDRTALPHLTHLDLSYWPSPVKDGSVRIDWQSQSSSARPMLPYAETQIGIKRINALGKMCRGLTWLGLEGCESWISILTEEAVVGSTRPRSRFQLESPRGPQVIRESGIQIDWNGVWRGLEALNVQQSWNPWLFEQPPETTSEMSFDRFADWWKAEQYARKMEAEIRDVRLAADLNLVRFQYTRIPGWADLDIKHLGAIAAYSRYGGSGKRKMTQS